MRLIKLLAIFLVIITLGACVGMKTTQTDEERKDVLYTCDCGPQCKCNTVSTKPGNCACGAPLKWGHIVKAEGNDALLVNLSHLVAHGERHFFTRV